MNLESLIEKRVILTVRAPEAQDKEIVPNILSAENTDIFTMIARIVDFDSLGIWIEKPDYPVYNHESKKVEKHTAHVLIRFEFITAIAAFPDMDQGGLSKSHRIGFEADLPEV